MTNLDERLKSKYWRLTHLYKIKNKQGQLVTFKPNLMQLRHLAEAKGHRYRRILKSRQFGFTTLYCIDYLDEALWVPGMSCGILAHEQKYNEKIFSIVKRAFDNLPEHLKPKTKTNTKYDYVFEKRFDGAPLDSSIYVATGVRSGTVLKLHITEAAWQKDYSELKAGAKQAVPKTGMITEETTANGFNEFFDDFSASEEIEAKGQRGDYDYQTFFYAWWENDEYSLPGVMPEIKPEDRQLYGDEVAERAEFNLTDGQLLWRRWKINELRKSNSDDGVTLNGLQLFDQEYPASRARAFQSGAGNIFDVTGYAGVAPKPREAAVSYFRPANYDQLDEVSRQHADVVVQEQMAKFDVLYKLGVNFWQFPEPGHSYVMGGDPSDGTGGDFADLDVWDKETLEQVAQLHTNSMRPDQLAEVAAALGWFYNEAFIGIENNMLTCILFLVKIYSRYYMDVRIDKKTQVRTKTLGYSTNTKTRDPMIDEFVAAWEEGLLTINSAVTFAEMKTFVKKENGKREHATGKKDDALFGAFIALQMRKLEPKRGRALASKPF